MAHLARGSVFAGHQIEEVLGRGGMGVVYRATHLRLKRSVALKLIAPELSDDPLFRRRVERESEIAASLRHPHVVTVFDAGEAEGALYLTMELIDGPDLRALIRREGRLEPRRLSLIVAQIASALDAAHARQLVHRDVKPGNVLIARGNDGGEHAYLTDFGLTKHPASDVTDSGTLLGTLDYIAPEQIRGAGVDARTDVYALGCVLFHALTGEVVFPQPNGAAKLFGHLSDAPRAPRDATPTLAPAWDEILACALAKDSLDRYVSAGDLGHAVVDAARGRRGARLAAGETVVAGARAEAVDDGRRKAVTVLFCDLAGSTAAQRLDPESLRQVITRYHDSVRVAVEHHGGTVVKSIGNTVMAVFGVPVVHEDDALRAIRAAHDMRLALRALNRGVNERWGVRLEARTGIDTGQVVAGTEAGEPFIVGEPVTIAARLEREAEAGDVLIGEATCRLVRDAVAVEPIEAPTLDGASEAVPAYRVLEARPVVSGHAPRVGSPLVGRGEELQLLAQRFARAVEERACELVSVMGPAGVGKSRLVEEFAVWLGARARVLRGRCLPYGTGITFWPVAEVMREAAGIGDDDSPRRAREKLQALLPAGEDRDAIVSLLAGALGLTPAGSQAQEIYWAVRKNLEALAAEEPLVLLLDDVHWGEPAFLDLLEYLDGYVRDAPVLPVCLARPELREVRPSLTRSALVVPPLAAGENEELIGNLLGTRRPAAEVTSEIMRSAEGNPLFVEEILRGLLDEGLLERRDGRWAARADLTTVAVPPTIQALLAARLDRLDDTERRVLQSASVIGEEFSRNAVAHLVGGGVRERIGRHLDTLVDKELLRPDGGPSLDEQSYRFGHILICDVAYGGLLKDARADLHARFADWLEQRAGARVAEYGEILGYHLEQAFRYRETLQPGDPSGQALAHRAAQRLGSAGQRAFARSDPAAATKLLERASELLAERDPWRLELMVDLAIALHELGDVADAERVIAAVTEHADASDERGITARALLVRSSLELFAGSSANAQRASTVEAVRTLEDAGDELGLARAWMLMAELDTYILQFGPAQVSYERAVHHARRAGARREEEQCLLHAANGFALGPTPAPEALARCEELLAEASRRPRAEAFILAEALSVLHAMQGQFPRARALYSRGRTIAGELGLRVDLVSAVAMAGGFIEMLAGDPIAAERELRRAYESLADMGEKPTLSTIAALLAQALMAQRKVGEAERFVEIADAAAPRDDLASQGLIRAVRAQILAGRGELAEADRLVREAIAIAAPTDDYLLHCEALAAGIDVLMAGGDRRSAVSMLEELLGLHMAKGNVVSANVTRMRLAELV